MHGSVKTEINGTEFFLISAIALEVLDIWNNDTKDSCIRAPPLAEKQTNGTFFSIHSFAARENFSPTTEPIDPPIKENSKAATITFIPLIFPSDTTKASFSFVVF